MRNRYSSYQERFTEIDIGETHVTVREQSGRVLVARILEKQLDANGRITSLLLDRMVHEHAYNIKGWKAQGCFVTELVPDGGY